MPAISLTHCCRATLVMSVLLYLLGSFDVQAQVRLPNVPVPELPPIQLPNANGLIGTADVLDGAQLRDLRRTRVRDLLRRNRRELEADPSGAPIVRAQLAAYDPSEQSLALAQSAGFSVVKEIALSALDIRLVVLAPPPRMSTRAALRRLRAGDPTGRYDYNHVYIESGEVARDANSENHSAGTTDLVERAQDNAPIRSSVKVGLIDTGIATTHSVFHAASITQFGCETPIPAAHGTAVASILVGDAEHFLGAAPNAALFSVDVYCGQPTGGSVENIAKAFAWLHAQNVAVINVSLVGPRNAILEQIVASLIAKGHIIVAAVGNDGPSAPALYPAAYPGVIGVTGVDAKRRVLIEALRGPQVYFSAPGADMGAADIKDRFVDVRGTSFAAPIVAGLLAHMLSIPDADAAHRVIERLASEAIDLGAPGVDKIYGHGLVGEAIRIEPKRLASKP